MHNINRKIRELRLSHQLTMARMAELIGVSPGNISDWESDKKKSTPTAKALIAIANHFQVSLDWLMDNSEPRHSGPPALNPYIQQINQLAPQLTVEDLRLLQSLAEHLASKQKQPEMKPIYAGNGPSDEGLVQERSLAAEYFTKLPLVGKITAGTPILAMENIEEYISVPNHLVGSGNHFVLRVQGDSMIDKGILSGDLVVVRQQHTADNGEIVVALVDREEATLKTFYLEKEHIRLQPANNRYSPIYSRKVNILGKVTGIMRSADNGAMKPDHSATKEE
ncbi:transcriptional repressor LexA [Paenibacillus tarimensis]|uniref:transcriptional repressor LexA n=3 Tax=Paenibacillus tarimensis TaxID=416012 RepID=UPI001F2EBADD|nr:transcriptional repressor LexA [Paenibacillus tarimensis]MCF2945611.1 transcriptional repressor LexA [Paenibacillus tarimensis]